MPLVAERFFNHPVIRPDMDDRIGSNINGPSLIAAPEWLPNRLGNYYLYFSHHKGSFIRLAYADHLEGPWNIYRPGVLDVKDSLFAKTDPVGLVESSRAAWSLKLKDDYLYAHVASPDVHVDHEQQKIRMYYHGLLSDGDQQTRHAESGDGLRFTPDPALLGPPYFRVFRYQQWIYALSWAGEIHRAKQWAGPFERGPRIIPDPPDANNDCYCRHCAVAVDNQGITVFYSRIGDLPEHIVMCSVQANDDWHSWVASAPETALKPELDWEGTDCELKVSAVGTAGGRVQELRDPCYFKDTDGQQYLLYSGAGESTIGLVRLRQS